MRWIVYKLGIGIIRYLSFDCYSRVLLHYRAWLKSSKASQQVAIAWASVLRKPADPFSNCLYALQELARMEPGIFVLALRCQSDHDASKIATACCRRLSLTNSD